MQGFVFNIYKNFVKGDARAPEAREGDSLCTQSHAAQSKAVHVDASNSDSYIVPAILKFLMPHIDVHAIIIVIFIRHKSRMTNNTKTKQNKENKQHHKETTPRGHQNVN
jgi:hypothetical protein